jgi:glycerol uptake facilitator-like aquaporin
VFFSSGGHFNPAVTLGVALSGKIPPLNAVAYVIAQLLGGFVGGFLVRVSGAVV